MAKQKKTTLLDIGERGLIHRFLDLITPSPRALLEGSEDAVAVSIDDDAFVINTDMLVESTDILPGMTAADIAWKTGVMGLSDLAAKGATPLGVVASFGFPETLQESYALALIQGLDRVCREHETYYLGGDTNQCLELVINCTAFGTVAKDLLIKRKGANPGDFVAVTGEFGYSGALFKAIRKDYDSPKRILNIIQNKAFQPKARLREGQELAKAGVVTSAIDSSDGLAWSLHELAKASQVGFQITQIPIPKICRDFAAVHNLDIFEIAFYGGEEFELVVTIPPSHWSEALQIIHNQKGELFKIGRVTSKEELIFEQKGRKRLIEPQGYEHFSRS